MSFAIAVLLVALPAEPDGGTDAGRFAADDPLYAVCPTADPPLALEDGGFRISDARASRNACLAVTCDERRRFLEPIAAGPVPFSSGSLVMDLLLWGVGLAAGLVLGFQLRGLFR